MDLGAFDIRPGQWDLCSRGSNFEIGLAQVTVFPQSTGKYHRHKTENVSNVSHAGPPHRLNLTCGNHEREPFQFPSAGILDFVCRSRDEL